jgi:hypothetical protein
VDVLAVLLGTPFGMLMVWWVFRAVFRRVRPNVWLGFGLGLPMLFLGMMPVLMFAALFGVIDSTTEWGRLSGWGCILTMVITYQRAKAAAQG